MLKILAHPRIVACFAVAAFVVPAAAVAGWQYVSDPQAAGAAVVAGAPVDVPIDGLSPSEKTALISALSRLELVQVTHVGVTSPPGPTSATGSGPWLDVDVRAESQAEGTEALWKVLVALSAYNDQVAGASRSPAIGYSAHIQIGSIRYDVDNVLLQHDRVRKIRQPLRRPR